MHSSASPKHDSDTERTESKCSGRERRAESAGSNYAAAKQIKQEIEPDGEQAGDNEAHSDQNDTDSDDVRARILRKQRKVGFLHSIPGLDE